MPPRNPDLHGNAPDTSRVALVLVDVINDLEFEGGERLLPHALASAARLADLASRARAAGVPVIYVNDNFGRWRSDFRTLLRALPGTPGAWTAAGSTPALELLLRPLSRDDHAHPHRPHGGSLRAVHGERCVHARFSAVRARGLRRVARSRAQPPRARRDGPTVRGRPDRVHAARAGALRRQAAGPGRSSAIAVRASASSAACARISCACRLSCPSAQASLTGSTPLEVSRSPREARPVHVPPCACMKPIAATKSGRNRMSRAPRATPK